MRLCYLVVGQSFQEKGINMAEKKCSTCSHDCHCDGGVCNCNVQYDLSDESQICGCGVCNCKPKAPDWG